MSFKPWLWLPVQTAHDWAPQMINVVGNVMAARRLEWRPLQWRGLSFPNRLGIAGGVDKDGIAAGSWIRLGAGFIEVGTVTPLPQNSNPGPTVDRDLSRHALWNKLGFPSRGADFVRYRLEGLSRNVPLFVNIGKNRGTPNERAAEDYAAVARALSSVCDGLVVNVSSPNTQGLRDLQQADSLAGILSSTRSAGKKDIPMFLKVSPDVSEGQLESILDVSLKHGVDGWILTNTTSARPQGIRFPAEGGLSGVPLAPRSKELLKHAVSLLGPRKGDRLLISVGGISTASDVRERLDMGADLTQVYSALIFSGPNFFRDVARDF